VKAISVDQLRKAVQECNSKEINVRVDLEGTHGAWKLFLNGYGLRNSVPGALTTREAWLALQGVISAARGKNQ